MDEKVYGIDFGATYSVIASLDGDAKPEVFEILSEAERTLASAVYFQYDGYPVVGSEAKAMANLEPDRVVQFVKQQIGKDNVRYTFDYYDYDPIMVSSLILKHMKEDVEAQGYPVRKVVLTCPTYFGYKEKSAMRQAGEIAGLEVMDIIQEPTAATLNYCLHEFRENSKIMVYDLGGCTFDVTLLNFSLNEFYETPKIKIIASRSDDKLGGIDWDKSLFEYICEVYSNYSGISPNDIDERTKAIILAQVENTKKNLSLKTVHKINIGGSRLEIEAEKFRERTKNLVKRTIYFVEQLLQENGLSPDNVETVLLVGGSTKMPMIQEAIKAMFPEKGDRHQRVRIEKPDFAVAKGAAIWAMMFSTRERACENLQGSLPALLNTDTLLQRDALLQEITAAILDDLILDNLDDDNDGLAFLKHDTGFAKLEASYGDLDFIPDPKAKDKNNETIDYSNGITIPDRLLAGGNTVHCRVCDNLIISGANYCPYCGCKVTLETPSVDIKKVEFSAIVPKQILKGSYTIINLVMYEKESRYVVEAIINEMLNEMGEPALESRSGVHNVKDGSSVKVVLVSPDITIDDNEETGIWQGDHLNFSFAVFLPEEYKKSQILFIASVYVNDVIATKLKFITKCSSPSEQKIIISREDIFSAFISYASQDRKQVATIIQGMKKARPDMDVFFDVESLRSGEDWEKALYREIERRDVLFLCWSHFARESKWVNAEWRYALQQKGAECIEPVPIESPNICPPPEELRHKHFNDKLLYVINS